MALFERSRFLEAVLLSFCLSGTIQNSIKNMSSSPGQANILFIYLFILLLTISVNPRSSTQTSIDHFAPVGHNSAHSNKCFASINGMAALFPADIDQWLKSKCPLILLIRTLTLSPFRIPNESLEVLNLNILIGFLLNQKKNERTNVFTTGTKMRNCI